MSGARARPTADRDGAPMTTHRRMFRPEFSTATDMRVVQSRKALRDALPGLLKQKSFDKISVREIVAAAGVGYNTFFRHYPDRESILHDIAAEEIRQLVSRSIAVLDVEDTLAACSTLCRYVDENRALWNTLLTGGAAGSLREEYVRVAREVCRDRPRAKDWVPFDIAIILVTGGIFELLAWWLGEADPLPVDDVARICQKIIVSPVIDP